MTVGTKRKDLFASFFLFRGDLDPPEVQEYRVHPVPAVVGHERIKNPGWRDPIPFTSRSILNLPDEEIFTVYAQNEVKVINDILLEITGGFGLVNCGKKCLSAISAVPHYSTPDQHIITFYLTKNIEGTHLHHVGVEYRINFNSKHKEEWFVEMVWVQGTFFYNFDEVRKAKDAGTLVLKKVPDPDGLFTKNLRSSLHFRGDPRPSAAERGPRSLLPEGRRFTTNGREVKWLGWEFEFSMLSSGMQLHNVKFLKERIAYELSLQVSIDDINIGTSACQIFNN